MTINGPGVVFVKVKVSTDIRAMIITISNLHIKVCLEISFLVFLFKKLFRTKWVFFRELRWNTWWMKCFSKGYANECVRDERDRLLMTVMCQDLALMWTEDHAFVIVYYTHVRWFIQLQVRMLTSLCFKATSNTLSPPTPGYKLRKFCVPGIFASFSSVAGLYASIL